MRLGVTDRVLRYITRYGPCEAWRVADGTGITPSTVHGVIQNLERGGRVAKDGVGEKAGDFGPEPPLWKATGAPKKKRGPKSK